MNVVFRLAERITVLAQGTPWSRTRPITSKATRRSAKPTSAKHRCKEQNHERTIQQTCQQRRHPPAFLSVWEIEAYYGESYIVQNVSFNIHEGEILALLGRNGAGKTSTLRTIARMDDPTAQAAKSGWITNHCTR